MTAVADGMPPGALRSFLRKLIAEGATAFSAQILSGILRITALPLTGLATFRVFFQDSGSDVLIGVQASTAQVGSILIEFIDSIVR